MKLEIRISRNWREDVCIPNIELEKISSVKEEFL